MPKKTQKQYTADFKAKVVKEMLSEEKTVILFQERDAMFIMSTLACQHVT